jgi:hypothetical protein
MHTPIRTLLLAGALFAAMPASATTVKVNGYVLSKRQLEVFRYIANTVVPKMPGNHDAQIHLTALATWWSLREGVISDWQFHRVPIIHRFSSCHMGGEDVLNTLDGQH